jgi:hypothetical protein
LLVALPAFLVLDADFSGEVMADVILDDILAPELALPGDGIQALIEFCLFPGVYNSSPTVGTLEGETSFLSF